MAANPDQALSWPSQAVYHNSFNPRYSLLYELIESISAHSQFLEKAHIK